ncbi:hypothetical protein [Streptomyces lanatus]|uniref:Uncharacterized protein n=1 Tax=Streptomyces lanatus TaxID=66900 RepID=A0ABV1XYB3_9ACTN|nr:hypothetical protein [Streptomyces lanatus]
MLSAVGLTNVGGRPRVVGAGGCGSVVLGDIDSGEWGEPIAVTCTYAPYPDRDFTSVLRAWDLEGGHALGGPVDTHEGGALGVQLAELEGRTVAVTVGCGDAAVRVWAVGR